VGCHDLGSPRWDRRKPSTVFGNHLRDKGPNALYPSVGVAAVVAVGVVIAGCSVVVVSDQVVRFVSWWCF
jgi:hypothetical protein